MGDMAERKREQHGGNPRPEGINGKVEVRPRNWLVPVTLLTLRDCTTYGYKLMEQTAKFGFEAMNPGTYYRTLRNMERDGLCESEWETSRGGPARRMYSITDAGEAYLEFWAEALEQYRRNIDAFFSLYTGSKPTRKDQQEDDR
jgi:PadR family transcriptional regulator, regulatory protein PadR